MHKQDRQNSLPSPMSQHIQHLILSQTLWRPRISLSPQNPTTTNRRNHKIPPHHTPLTSQIKTPSNLARRSTRIHAQGPFHGSGGDYHRRFKTLGRCLHLRAIQTNTISIRRNPHRIPMLQWRRPAKTRPMSGTPNSHHQSKPIHRLIPPLNSPHRLGSGVYGAVQLRSKAPSKAKTSRCLSQTHRPSRLSRVPLY